MESFKNSFSKWQMKHINASAENIVAFRKFGHKVSLSMFQNQFGVMSLNDFDVKWVKEHAKAMNYIRILLHNQEPVAVFPCEANSQEANS